MATIYKSMKNLAHFEHWLEINQQQIDHQYFPSFNSITGTCLMDTEFVYYCLATHLSKIIICVLSVCSALNFQWVMVMVFNATFNNISVISWMSVLLVEETGVHEKTTHLSQWVLFIIINIFFSTLLNDSDDT